MEKICDGKCLKCQWHKIVEDKDPDDWFNDDDQAMFCTNPKNNMEREWTSESQRNKIVSVLNYKVYLDKGYTFICGAMRPYELDKDNEEKVFANQK